MTKWLKITRDDVLLAIKEEPLTADTWASEDVEGNCQYCAIGATVSRALGSKVAHQVSACATRITKFVGSSSDSLPQALKDAHWISAISIKFEQLAFKKAEHLGVVKEYSNYSAVAPECLTYKQVEEIKPELIEWILATVPDGVLYDGVV